MRAGIRRVLLLGLGLVLVAPVACNDPIGPAGDTQDPDPCVELTISTGLLWSEQGIMVTTFSADPLCTSDNLTPRHELDARWDFEDDGAWDTDWIPLRFADCFVPDPLPTETWRVRLAVRDGAGNTREITEERPIPDWLPPGPDLGLGFIRTSQRLVFDPYQLLEHRAETVVWGWNLASWEAVTCELHVDGELVHRQEMPPLDIVNRDCLFDGGWLQQYFGAEFARLMTPGTHEVTIIVDADNEVAEVDETNNSRTVTVEIPAAEFLAGE